MIASCIWPDLSVEPLKPFWQECPGPGGDPTKVDLLAFARTAGINWMPAAGFSSPTNVDFHKCRHIQMSPHLSGHIHPQSHNSLVKSRIYDN